MQGSNEIPIKVIKIFHSQAVCVSQTNRIINIIGNAKPINTIIMLKIIAIIWLKSNAVTNACSIIYASIPGNIKEKNT